MKTCRSAWSLAAIAALGLTAFASGSVAQARDLAWSVGVASPGVQVGVSSGSPLIHPRPLVLPAPVYYGNPQPDYYGRPQPIYYGNPQPIYYGQPQVVYVPAPPYMRAGWMAPAPRHGWRPHGRWNHGGRGRHDEQHGFGHSGSGGGRH